MEVYLTFIAKQNIEKLPRSDQKRVIEKIEFYAAQPDPLEFAEPLSGVDEYRFRAGVYRVRFEVLNNLIWVVSVKRRDEAYR
jgi:mRNA-degrading endonuclease RelE of RelBE toxin-antitoxin system